MEAEELNKHADESTSSSSEDDEANELTEEIEKDFFKTLACLKNKDPRIYNENVTFFENKNEGVDTTEKKKKKKDAQMYLKDYETKLLLEKGGIFSDEEEEDENKSKFVGYDQELELIKKSLKNTSEAIEDDGEDGDEGGLFTKRKKTKEEVEKEELNYKKWLAGKNEDIDGHNETELKPLKDYWCNPNLDEGEKFLRDYILNKKYLDKEDDYVPTYEEIVNSSVEDLSDDEKTLKKQEEFEHKVNFRFEEPDQEFIKRYPRTLENSLRKENDKRKQKRKEIKERKKMAKKQKLSKLEVKLEKLKEVNGDIQFEEDWIEKEYDPEEFDKRMQTLFNDDYYQRQDENQKPVFPELDKELEIENSYGYETKDEAEYSPHCEDEDFNMDCDYDANAASENKLIESSKSKKKRKRKSKIAEALSKPEPTHEPAYENNRDTSYKYNILDCDNINDESPFKYRIEFPNTFGLSLDEIYYADEKELNKWCSLKKSVTIRPDHVEKYEKIAYEKKAQNIMLKSKIFPSLYTTGTEDDEHFENKVESVAINDSGNSLKREGDTKKESIKNMDNSSKIRNKKKKKKKSKIEYETSSHSNITEDKETECQKTTDKKLKTEKPAAVQLNDKESNKKKKRKSTLQIENEVEHPRKKVKNNKQHNKYVKKEIGISDARLSAYGINPKKFKNKLKYSSK